MSGNRSGGLKTRETLYDNFGQEYFKVIGAVGGKASNTGGFYKDKERASRMGKIGGSISRRKPGTYGKRSNRQPAHCTFCSETGHSAWKCPVRADIKLRKELAAARYKVAQEQAELNRDKLSAIARKWANK